MKNFVLFFIFASSLSAQASIGPRFYSAMEQNQDSSMTMECTGDSPFPTLECQMTRIDIRKSSDEDLDRLFVANLSKLSFYQKNCPHLKSMDEKTLEALPPARQAGARIQKKFFDDSCRCAANKNPREGLACLKKATADGRNLQAKTCIISTLSFKLTLKRTDHESWSSSEKANDPCGKIQTYELAKDTVSSSFYALTHRTENPKDLDKQKCKDLSPEISEQFSSRFNMPLKADCEFVLHGAP